MKSILSFLFILSIILNIKLILGKIIIDISPHFKGLQTGIKDEAITLTFSESVIDENKTLTLKYHYDNNKKIVLVKHANNKETNKVYYNFDHDYFLQNNFNFGYYDLVYDDGNETIKTDKKILFYLNDIELKNPVNRYFLTGDSSDEIKVYFDFREAIVKDQINRVSHQDNSDFKNYDLSIDNKTLIITLNRSKNVKTFNFQIYQTIDEDNDEPINFNIYFQDFIVYNEAVYANESSRITRTFILLEFRYANYKNEEFSLSLDGVNTKINGYFQKKENKTFYYFNITQKPSPGKIIVNYQEQKRPIFLVTYNTDKNHCYLKGTTEKFDITFKKTAEMEYTNSYFFLANPNQYLEISGKETTNSKFTKGLNDLYEGTFYLYSFISRLSSLENNAIDYPFLYITIYEDKNLIENNETSLYTNINTKQSIYFNMSNVGFVDKVFLNSRERTIELSLQDNEQCKKINDDIYSCDFTNIEDTYLGKYNVSYECQCDNKRLQIQNKIINIEKGIFLNSIAPKWSFNDSVVDSEVTLTYSFNVGNDIKILFCGSDNTCHEQNIIDHIGQRAVIVKLENLKLDIYYIKTNMDGQIIQNDNLKFKVLDKKKFIFNHHYFVKNNGAKQNYLNITKDFKDDKITILKVDGNIENNSLNTYDNISFFYEINRVANPRSGITFSYFDVDIEEYIPIQDNITVVNTISQLINVDNLKNCYYYNFSITIPFQYKINFDKKIFLYNNTNKKTISFKNNNINDIFELNEEIEKEYLIEKNNLELYISEKYEDTTVYLYKSGIEFSNISVPEFVIYPNKTIYFSDIFCDLCKSDFKMANGNNKFELNENCDFSQNGKSMTIQGSFYNFNNGNNNNDYNYKYLVDDKEVKYNDKKLSTFVSNRLDQSVFIINLFNKNDTSYNITIINTNKDFYFPLISTLTFYKIVKENNKKTEIVIYKNNPTYEFVYSDNNYEMSFSVDKGNYILNVSHLAREVKGWENIEKNTQYHYFNKIFDDIIFTYSPNVFASHALTEETYNITITFVNKELLNKYTKEVQQICKHPVIINNLDINCTIISDDVTENKAQIIEKYISDYPIFINLIYYNMSRTSNCITLTEANNIFYIIIDMPKNFDSNQINLMNNNNYFYERNFDTSKNKITFPISILDMRDLDNSYYIKYYLNDIKIFSLKDFGVKFFEKYEFKEKGNKFILLPQNNQVIKLTLSETNSNNKIDDIISRKFKIWDYESINSNKINDNSFNITFNLANKKTSDNKLYYIDSCGAKIDTGITLGLLSFTFKRHYFIINNNNGDKDQYLIIENEEGEQIQLFINSEDDQNFRETEIIYDTSIKAYRYLLPKVERKYSFYYSNKNNNNDVKNKINDKVYVKVELYSLFKIITNFAECMYYDTGKNLYFTIIFKEEKYDDSIFGMRLEGEEKNLISDYEIIPANQDSETIQFTFVLKDKGIPQNKILLIYFYENDDRDQPLYLYKYQYTNITLNSKYKDVIYSDAIFLKFDIFCNISNLKPFYIYDNKTNENKGKLECSSVEYEIDNNIIKCILNNKSEANNPFINKSLKNEYYYLLYDSSYQVGKEFYFSKSICDSDFYIKLEDDIYPSKFTEVKLNSSKNMFYLPYIDNITFQNCSNKDCEGWGFYHKLKNELELEFEGEFNENNNHIKFSLFISGKWNYYYINEICRNVCDYCWQSDCKYLNISDDYKIASNIPDIIFEFNRYYISLSDSLYNGIQNSNLTISFKGTEKELLEKITYRIYTNDCNRYEEKVINDYNYNGDKNDNYTVGGLREGMYEFFFKASNNERYFPVLEKIFVVNKDYELLNINYLEDYCIFYDDEEKILFTSLTINESYIFKSNASRALNDLTIYFGNTKFNYINSNSGYKLRDNSFDCIPGKGYNYSIIEDYNENVVFTQLRPEKYCTKLSHENYFYKDNIIFEQTCDLNNMFLNERDAHILDGVSLNCEFDNDNNKSYCNIQKDFKIPMYEYNLYFKYGNNLLNTNQRLYIYNSINDSKFDIDFKNPNLSIISSNFDLNNLSEIFIDNRTYNTSFDIKTTDKVTFTYLIKLNDTSRHYLTKLLRRNKTNDRINTIKHKDLRIEIKEIECPEFQKAYLSRCWYCSELIKIEEYPEEKKWYQNGECVEKCNFTAGYGIFDQYNFYCQQCKEKTRMNDNEGNLIYLCSCLEGTVKSLENDVCYLPEMDEITKLTNIQKNTQCYKADGVSHNYCNQNQTKSCAVETINGYFFPICNCQDGYIGKYCEFDKGNFSLINNLNDILSDNNIINEANITIIAKVRGITHFLEIESDTYIQQFNDTSMSIYIDSSIRIIDNIINSGKKTFPQIFDVVELAIFFLNHRITNNKKLRNLQETENDINRLNYLLNNLHYVYVQANLNSKQNYKIQTDKLNLTTFIVYKKGALADESFKLEMANLSFFKIMEYIDLNNKTEDDDLIFITLINSSLFKNDLQSSEDFGVRAYFSTSHDIDITTNQNNSNIIDTVNNFTFYISSSVIHFNFYLAEYYFNRNIKIYDKNDKAFVEPCFLSEDFDFDLTQKYRKNNVFQKMNYGNEYCKYVNFEYKYKRLNFICQGFSNYNSTNDLRYAMLNFNIQKESISDANKVYNLPTKCTKKIKSVGSNWAFWFFLIICILELIYCIGIGFLTFGSLRNISFRKGLVLDEFYQIIPFRKDKNEDSISNSVQLPKYKEKEEQKNKRNNYNYSDDESNNNNSIITTEEESFNKSFVTCFLHNLKELHPLSTLCRVSVLSPLVLNSIIFVFNTLVLFGFNALLYYESLIEKRIYNKKRNNFDYPMLKEFHKIILSILCQIVLCILIKFIHLVTLKQRNELKNNLRTCYIDRYNSINNKIIAKVQDFQDEMFLRRIISSCVMVIIVTFFFYYSVAFCAVYIQTQRNWFFSGIWSLFWNWVILAPILIFIISLIEYKKKDLNDSTIYYMKRLFCF